MNDNVVNHSFMEINRGYFFLFLLLIGLVSSMPVPNVYSPPNDRKLLKQLKTSVSRKSLGDAYYATEMLSPESSEMRPQVRKHVLV